MLLGFRRTVERAWERIGLFFLLGERIGPLQQVLIGKLFKAPAGFSKMWTFFGRVFYQ